MGFVLFCFEVGIPEPLGARLMFSLFVRRGKVNLTKRGFPAAKRCFGLALDALHRPLLGFGMTTAPSNNFMGDHVLQMLISFGYARMGESLLPLLL